MVAGDGRRRSDRIRYPLSNISRQALRNYRSHHVRQLRRTLTERIQRCRQGVDPILYNLSTEEQEKQANEQPPRGQMLCAKLRDGVVEDLADRPARQILGMLGSGVRGGREGVIEGKGYRKRSAVRDDRIVRVRRPKGWFGFVSGNCRGIGTAGARGEMYSPWSCRK